MKQKLAIFLMMLVTFLVQTSWRLLLPSAWPTANLMLLFVVSMSFMRGSKSGIWIGFFTGLLWDLTYGDLFGFTALLFLYAGYLNGRMYQVFSDRNIVVPTLACGLTDMACNLLFWMVSMTSRQPLPLPQALTSVMLPEMGATMLCALGVYWIYYGLNRVITRAELEEEQSPWLKK